MHKSDERVFPSLCVCIMRPLMFEIEVRFRGVFYSLWTTVVLFRCAKPSRGDGTVQDGAEGIVLEAGS